MIYNKSSKNVSKGIGVIGVLALELEWQFKLNNTWLCSNFVDGKKGDFFLWKYGRNWWKKPISKKAII
jgi:hypothetical protein